MPIVPTGEGFNVVERLFDDQEVLDIVVNGKSLNTALMRLLLGMLNVNSNVADKESLFPSASDSNADLINKLAYCFGFSVIEAAVEEILAASNNEEGPTGDPVPVSPGGEEASHT